MKKNLIKTITIILAASTLITGCGNKKSDEITELQNKVANLESTLAENNNTTTTADSTDSKNIDDDKKTNEPYSKELAQFVYQGDIKSIQNNARDPINYMSCTGESEQKDGTEKIYKYETEFKTLQDPPYDIWSTVLIITNDEMIETNPQSSIIKNKVQLKLPLEEGNKWEQQINYNGKDYTMKHEIIEIAKNKNVKNICVKSTIDNFGKDGFTYIEAAIYQQGRGIIASDSNHSSGLGYTTFGLVAVEEKFNNNGESMGLSTYHYYSGIDISKAFE